MLKSFWIIAFFTCAVQCVIATGEHENEQCKENEVLSKCGGSVCGYSKCSEIGKTIDCVLPSKGPCKKTCVCKDTYLRADNGTCIPAKQCPNALKCPKPNESYTICPSTCPTRVCNVVENGTSCPDPLNYDDPRCPPPECRCNDGFYRDVKGNCVTWNLCNSTVTNQTVPTTVTPSNTTTIEPVTPKPTTDDQCEENEVYDNCVSDYLVESCDTEQIIVLWPQELDQDKPNCSPGCRCRDGYLRDDCGFCIPQDKCPKPTDDTCGLDEVPVDCVKGGCGFWYCGQTVEICLLPGEGLCEEGCRCKDGYLKAFDGTCIPSELCPPKCNGPHEYFSCGAACDNVCATLSVQNQTNCLIRNKRCNPMCYCQEGYARDHKNICVPISKCPPVCGINEVYDTCIAGCPPRRCDVDERVIKCGRPLEPGDPKCEAGCRCADGFYRNDKNVCVPRNECPIVCEGENEVAGCEDSCPQTCESFNQKCHSVQSDLCIPQCRCKDGFYRNKIGKCISKENCLKCTGPNEYFSCGVACDNVCATLSVQNQTNCLIRNKRCNPMCYCQEGYARDHKNICVPISKCPPVCGINEVYDTCIAGCPPRRCDVDERVIKCGRPLEPGDPKCEAGCRCADGFYRNDKNVCVPRNECPIICRGQNEVAGCEDSCPQTCESINQKCHSSVHNDLCRPQCRCKDGFYRNKIGNCISKENCLKCTGPNEYFSCGRACDNVCATLHKQNQTNCPIFNIVCNPKCYCEAGYARDYKNICVPIPKCPPVCGINEVYDTCLSTCPPRRCDVDERLILCMAPLKHGDPKCQAGCRCADGFYRNDKNICVSRSECPIICRGQNEVAGCEDSCPQTCESINQKCHSSVHNGLCRPQCRCKDGFYRNKIGDCISKENCLKCTGPNEYFSCGRACDNVCATLHKQNQTNCPIVNVVCNPKCYCEKGYARDCKNVCIPIPKCPPVCGKHEIYDVCPATCPPKTCDSIGKAFKCLAPLKPGHPDCKPSCRCIDGYYKNKRGQCVPKSDCPKPPGVICGTDEVYTSCFNGGCGRWNCSQSTISCVNLYKGNCKEGCHCKQGLLRADNGTCVPADKCPFSCCGKNEEIGCHSTCPQTCESIGKRYSCPLQRAGCQRECRCKPNFFRNKIGECISKEDCLKCTGPNEYFSCGRACDNVCATLHKQNQTHCPNDNFACKCYCEKGYARDCKNVCVPIPKCPPTCGINEIYDVCPSTCPPKTCDAIGRSYKCKAPLKPGDPNCTSGCRCADGYLRNKDGVCVLKNKCPKKPRVVCGTDEVYSSCVNGGCGRWECSKPGIVCIDLVEGGCREGCHCKKGLLRADNGTCVPADQCPLDCYGKNEVSGCHSICPAQTCENIGKKIFCPRSPTVCKQECRCKPGFYRNKIGECISEKDCLKCTGPNEYFSCGRACDNVCATLHKQNKKDCPIYTYVCQKMCYCLDGYARDSKNTCVPIRDCPTTGKNNNTLEKFERGNVIFTDKFLYEAAKGTPGVSLIFSPFSVLFLLAQLALYTTGTPLQQLLSLLNLDTKTDIRSLMPSYLDSLNSQRNVTFSLAEIVCCSIKYKFRNSFEIEARDIFKAATQSLDFSKSSESANSINQWVANKTNNLIKDLISPNQLDSNTVLVLVNAIYFKGDWKYPFDPERTISEEFYVNKNKNVMVNMMKQTKYFKYAEVNNPDAQVIELPYKSDNFSIMLWLPKNKDGIDDMVNEMGRSSFSLNNALISLKYEEVVLSVPRFNTSTTTDLKNMLMKANVTDMFYPETSNFVGIIEGMDKLYVSSAIQKATIIFNELGSEAAAANAIVVGTTSVKLDPPKQFLANHPFIYFILFRGTPIFCGICYGDSK